MLVDRLKDWLAHPRPPADLPLPQVEAPPLHDLRVKVPAPEDLTPDTLLQAYDAYLKSVAPRTVRADGEPSQAGDLLDVAMAAFQGSASDEAIPFTAQDHVELVAGGPWVLPGLTEHLVGRLAGEVVDVPVRFPDDWPATGLRGVSASYRVRVRQITELHLPDPDDEDLLPKLGITLGMDELMQALQDRWIDERSDALAEEGQRRVLDLLRGRAPIAVPRALIEREIWERWAGNEGRVLLELGASEADLNTSFAAWLRSDELAADITRRMHVSLLLGAIAKRDGLTLERSDIDAVLESAAEVMDEDPELLREKLRDDPDRAASVANQAFHRKVVRHVLDRAQITFLTR
jgi:trigger factor